MISKIVDKKLEYATDKSKKKISSSEFEILQSVNRKVEKICLKYA